MDNSPVSKEYTQDMNQLKKDMTDNQGTPDKQDMKGISGNKGTTGNKGNDGVSALELDMYEVSLSDISVLRLCRKVFAGMEVIDLRLWQRAKNGKLFPRKGQGLCMRSSAWKEALKLFVDNNLPLDISMEPA